MAVQVAQACYFVHDRNIIYYSYEGMQRYAVEKEISPGHWPWNERLVLHYDC